MARLITNSPRAIGRAIDLLGTDNLDPGAWTELAVFYNLSHGDAVAAQELLAEAGDDVQVVDDPR